MNNYILYYYLREDFSSPFYIGYGKPRRIHAKHLRSNGANLLPPRERRWIVKSGLTKEEAIELEIKHIALWKRECDGGVLLNQNLGGEGKPGGQKTKGFSGRKHSEEAKKRIISKVDAGTANSEIYALFEAGVDSCSLIYSNAERTSHKWYQAKITVADSYDMGNIHNDILSSSTYDADGNLQENIAEVEVVESQVTGYSNWSQIS